MPLLNAFIDSIVSVGFNADRGLKLESASKDKTTVFGSYLEPSLLAIVTGDRAIYPQAANNEFIDPNYPPMNNLPLNASMTGSTTSSNNSAPISSGIPPSKTQKQYIISGALKNLPMFCFPDGVRVSYQSEMVKIHHVVFTQEEGKRSYALILTLQQIFALKSDQPDDGVFQIEDLKTYGSNTRRPSVSKIPVPIDRKKLERLAAAAQASQAASSNSQDATSRARKMPQSYSRYQDRSTVVKPRSSTPTNSNGHAFNAHTFSSYVKSKSPTAVPPTPRLSRANSQSNMANGTSTQSSTATRSSSSSGMRKRSGSESGARTSVNGLTPKKPTATAPAPIVHDVTRPFYLPHCIVLISSQPYWTAMQETISIIYHELKERKIEISSNDYKQMIHNFAYLVCNTPVPSMPWERFSLSFNITYEKSVLAFDPPISPDRTVLDLDLSLLLLNLNIGKLLEVLAAVFTEQPIMFFSANYSNLVTTLECLMYLIYPLKWANVYVPLLPRGLEDYYLEGPPGAYIMGTHARYQARVEPLDFCCICNIDNQENIRIPSKTELHPIPPTKLKRFTGPITKLLDEIKVFRARQNTGAPLRVDLDQQRKDERDHRLDTNNRIIDIFFDLMVDLCGDIFLPIYWKMAKQQASPKNTLNKAELAEATSPRPTKTVFSTETYLASRVDGIERDFYEEFVKTTAFQLFLEEESKITQNSTPFRQVCQLRSSSKVLPYLDFKNPPSALDSDDEAEEGEGEEDEEIRPLAEAMGSQLVLSLPDWILHSQIHYLDRCIEVFTNELDNAQDERSTPAITVYAYLRGCALIARGYLLEGLQDLYLIENRNLFPIDYIINTVVPLLNEAALLQTFLHEEFYVTAPDWKKIHDKLSTSHMSVIDLEHSGHALDVNIRMDVSEVNIQEEELTYEQFIDHVGRNYIAMDEETVETLFKALLYWVDPHLVKALKRDKSLLRTPNKGESEGKSPRKFGFGNAQLKSTFDMLNKHRLSAEQAKGRRPSASQGRPALPGYLYESFLDIWRQTSAEKVRMNRCLPEERRSQESILKVSSAGVISKKDGPGQLILTQKRIYFLPEARSSAYLLTELKNIKTLEKFSTSRFGLNIHVAVTATSLPRDNHSQTKSKTSSLERDAKVITLLFKTNQEQEFWHAVILEIYSGLTIANKQCDTSMLNKASRHIALMDTLSHLNYNENSMHDQATSAHDSHRKGKQQHHNEKSLELALNDFKILTRMFESGDYVRLTRTTREVLTRRLSPSINEREIHPVRCVEFVQNPDNGRSALWCVYGSKLKVFNVTTWISDWKDLTFPSLINCMCLDDRAKLWVGCIDGQVFVVDTETYTYGEPLVLINGQNGCQTIAYDADRDTILTANQAGLVIPWNATTWERYDEFLLFDNYNQTCGANNYKSEAKVVFRTKPDASKKPVTGDQHKSKYRDSNSSNLDPNLPEPKASAGTTAVIPSVDDKLQRIQVYDDRLFACYEVDYLLIFRFSDAGTYNYEHIITVKYKDGESTPIDAFVVYEDQLWVATGNILHVFNVNNSTNNNFYNLMMKRPIEDDQLTTMVGCSDHVWAGSLKGKIYLFLMNNCELYKTFDGHNDTVFCLASMFDTHVISGAGRKDRSIAIWDKGQATHVEQASGSLSRTRSTTITAQNLPRRMTLTSDSAQ